MKISKDECDKDFVEYNLFLCEEKCGKCDYNRVCPYLNLKAHLEDGIY